MDLTDAQQRPSTSGMTVRPTVEELAAIEDPLDRLRASDEALTLIQENQRRVAALRQATLLDLADGKGVPVKHLADVLGVSPTRVRQLLITIRRAYGLPLRPAQGGKKSDPLSAKKLTTAVEALLAAAGTPEIGGNKRVLTGAARLLTQLRPDNPTHTAPSDPPAEDRSANSVTPLP